MVSIKLIRGVVDAAVLTIVAGVIAAAVGANNAALKDHQRLQEAEQKLEAEHRATEHMEDMLRACIGGTVIQIDGKPHRCLIVPTDVEKNA